MVGMLLEDRENPPETYNEEKINIILKKSEQAETNNYLQKPNIILMFQESYWDIENIEEIEFNEDIKLK